MIRGRVRGEWLLRAAMRCHPRGFRGEYEHEMLEHYRAVVIAEGSRRGIAWRLWFLWKCIGSAAYRGLVQRFRHRARGSGGSTADGNRLRAERRVLLAGLLRDARYAFRQLQRSPGITVVAVLSLALGIGANAAVFSLSEQMLLRPLPVPAPDRLVNLSAPGPKPGSNTCNRAGSCDAPVFSYPMFRDLEAPAELFTGIAAHRSFVANLRVEDDALAGSGMLVSGSYFSVLGLRPALGRLFGREDDRMVGGLAIVVLSHRFWQTRFGADPRVLNQTIAVNGYPLTIVGVAPPRFEGTTLGVRPDVFVPLTLAIALGDVRGIDSEEQLEARRNYWVYLFGRLKPGVSIEQAHAALNRVYRPIIQEVEAPLQEDMSVQTLARFRAREVTLEDGRRGQSTFHSDVGTPLLLLLTVTGVVVIIACANIANLLLARGATRAPELALRTSLGASRSQLLAQLLTESCLLAMLGGAASLLVARWTLTFIGAFLPGNVAAALDLHLPTSMLGFAAALSIGTGFLFGLYPALQATRPDLMTTIRANAGHRAGARAATRLRASLVTVQIALSMALLVLAGFFVLSLANVSRVDLGLRVDDVVTFRISPKMIGYQPERARSLFERTEWELAAIPGVREVAASRLPLLSGRGWRVSVSVEGFDAGPDADDGARYNEIGPGYFRALGIPLLAGREFTSADAGPVPTVAVVNESFARKFGLGREAVGKYMALGDDPLDIQIVGLVRDAKYHEVKQEVPPQVFLPYRQADILDVGAISFYVGTAVPPEEVLGAVPRVISRLDPALPVEDLQTMPELVREQVSQDRMIGFLSTIFAGLATLLAAVGLYGVIAYAVTQRTREIGLRIALGAESGDVRRMVLGQVARLVLAGGAIGIVAAFGLGAAARSLLFQVDGRDPFVFGAAAVVLTAVALCAGYLPARRAARVDPLTALRAE
ncbi:MAG: ABC transporter permease [Longimicrobiales bacterium]